MNDNVDYSLFEEARCHLLSPPKSAIQMTLTS
jgi:hypothetical protein